MSEPVSKPLVETLAARFWSPTGIALRASAYGGSAVTALASGTMSLPLAAGVVLFDLGWGVGLGLPSIAAETERKEDRDAHVPTHPRIGLLKALGSLRSSSRQRARDARLRVAERAANVGAVGLCAAPLALAPGSFATSGDTLSFLVSMAAAATLAPALVRASAHARGTIGVDHGRPVDDLSLDRLEAMLAELDRVVASDPPRISSLRSTGRGIASLLRRRMLPDIPLATLAPYVPGLSRDAYVDVLRETLPGLRAHVAAVLAGTTVDGTMHEALTAPMGAMRALMLDGGEDDPAWRVQRGGTRSERRTTEKAATVYERAKRIQEICELALAADPDLEDGDGGRVRPLVSEHLPRLLTAHEEASASSSAEHDEANDRLLVEGVEIVRSAVEDALSRSGAEKRDSLATELRFLRLRHPSHSERIAA